MKIWRVAVLLLMLSAAVMGQEVGTGADSSWLSVEVSYRHLGRDFSLAGVRQEISRGMLVGTVGFKPIPSLAVFGFAGSSDFPIAGLDNGRHLYFGGGLKYIMLGEVDIEEENGRRLNIRGSIDLDFRVGRLQSSGTRAFERFGLTEVQAALTFGLKVFRFAGYLGFKFGGISGEYIPGVHILIYPYPPTEVKGRGLFSLILGFNYRFLDGLSLVSEFSLFTESSWAFGLRWGIDRR